MSSNMFQQLTASFRPRRNLHVHTKVVYRSCSCFLATCAQPTVQCHEFIANGTLLTGDVLVESEEDFCPTCTRKFSEWVDDETESERSLKSVSSLLSSMDADEDTHSEEDWESVDGEVVEDEVMIEEEDGDEAQALVDEVIVDDCDSVMDPTFYDEDTHPLLLHLSSSQRLLTDEMLEQGPCPCPRPESPSSEISPEEGDRIRAELCAALEDAIESSRP